MFRYRNDSTNQSDLGDFNRPHHCRLLVYGETVGFFKVQLSTCLMKTRGFRRLGQEEKEEKAGR